MRIIAGRQNRRKLRAPLGEATRPILDRVKQALFDALGSHFGTPGRLPPLAVLDLYCGGGTLGIEALSRGAQTCVFVDSDRTALACLRRNVETLDLGGSVHSCGAAAESARVPMSPRAPFGLIFLDPPFPLSTELRIGSPLELAVRRLGTEIPVRSDALCIWRFDARRPPMQAEFDGWQRVIHRRYGRSELHWLARRGDDSR
ncbi:MAG: RsmD family RNA methyltransferase [Phycisphaerae bacterium]